MLFLRRSLRWILPLLLLLASAIPSSAQGVFPFTSGPIPMCATSTFTADVSGIGYLNIPNGMGGGPYLDSFVMNITTDHPQTLQITLTSPQGTTLLLSAFNGAGGQNYTYTQFTSGAWVSITTGSAPFTGVFMPQGGTMNDFAGENADGTWVVTVVDTACTIDPTGTGNGWTAGWFDGGTGSGAFGFGASTESIDNYMGSQTVVLCPGAAVDVLSYFANSYPGVDFTTYDDQFSPIADPYAVTQPGEYTISYIASGQYSWVYYHGTTLVVAGTSIDLGPDQVVDQCGSSTPVSLSSLFNLAGYDAAWSLNGQPITEAEAAEASTPGVYQVVANSGSGCPSTANVTLNFNPAPFLGADQQVSVCPGGTVDLGALYSTTGLTTEWTFAGTTVSDPSAVGDAGDYTLLATALGGCSATAQVMVTMDTPPSLGADQAVSICSNSDLDLTGLFAAAGPTQAWTLNGSQVPDPTAVSAAGTYQLVTSTGSACADTALVVVALNAIPALGADASAVICAGGTVDLTDIFPTTGSTREWYLNGAMVAGASAIGSAGLYTLVATNTAGCSDTASVQLTAAPSPELGADQDLTRCTGETVNLQALYLTGTGNAAWTLNGAAVVDPSAVAVAGSYSLVLTTAAGCTDTATVNLQFDPSPVLGSDQALTICAGESVDLNGLYNTAGLTAVWTLGTSPVNDPGAVHATGNYKLVATNALNCSDVAMVNLWVNTPPSLGPDQVLNICPWQIANLTTAFPVTGAGVTYTLDGQAVPDPTNVTEAGIYTVTSVDAIGCSDEAMATVVPVECLCVADFVENAHCVQEPVQFTLHADSTVLAAHWDFHGASLNANGPDPMVRFNEAGKMLVTLHATLSCGVVTAERIVNVPDCSDSCALFIPSAYTPNADGVNDGWTWQGDCLPEDYSMTVFDRWGAVVFSSTDPYKAWDGTVNGKELTAGVYAYRVAYRLLYQDAKDEIGTITLIR